MALTHGGNLNAAMARFGGRREQWLDLSTGISPRSWPVPPVPEAVWQRLPEADDDLVAAAAGYYGCDERGVLPVPGSQHAIALLPSLWPRDAVALPRWGYEEHRAAWEAAGHRCTFYRDLAELEARVADEAVHYAVVINPNNPLGELFDPASLLALASALGERGGRLLVDEAFIDHGSGDSLIPVAHPAVVVLRSVGKFFGLAGLRLGFALAPRREIAALAAATNPWAVSHPARWIGAAALADTRWQARQRLWIEEVGNRWRRDIQALLPGRAVRGAGLFASVSLPAKTALGLQVAAAGQALWLRVYGPRGDEAVVRFGLPPPGRERDARERLRRAVGNCEDLRELGLGQ
ncbi:threonine-phosphate decarboxylase CobD [Parahaliea mediterranea]|uniref:threonine-phosphate decarboxylase n=1 Tax=Parahaliea mediterranea TaxID=651086 RepID=A0A939IK05_9GAMM|nr:threonine-phosphate decarboxylase CobD [Parahaliea mediterranea]MBN7794955.1 threonine-phosphate decarboxylase [Parahaliea mediterranea]